MAVASNEGRKFGDVLRHRLMDLDVLLRVRLGKLAPKNIMNQATLYESGCARYESANGKPGIELVFDGFEISTDPMP